MLISLFSSLHNRRVVGKIVGNKLMTSLSVSLKLFWFQVHSEFPRKTKVFCMAIHCTNNSKSKFSTFKVTQDSKLTREWLIEMKRECLTPSKHSRDCAELFTGDSFEKNLTVRSLLGPSFKLRRLVLKWYYDRKIISFPFFSSDFESVSLNIQLAKS